MLFQNVSRETFILTLNDSSNVSRETIDRKKDWKTSPLS